MEDAIVLYATPEHVDSMLIFAKLIARHHPSVAVFVLSTAKQSTVAASIAAHAPSITYRILAADPIPTTITHPVEIMLQIPSLTNPSLRHELHQISQTSTIKAFVIDFFCNAAFQVSTSLDIPTYFFFTSGGSALCHFLYTPVIHETVDGNLADLNDFVAVPGCPLLHSSDFPNSALFRQGFVYDYFLSTAMNMRKCAGILVNSFDALEYRAKEACSNNLCIPVTPTPPVYFIGPLIGESGGHGGGRHDCLRWLDSQPSKSVIFLCFGRRGVLSAKQLREMAIGLENCGYRFLWSVRIPPEAADLEAVLSEGFLERTKGRGYVIKAWAPQKEVLSHDSVAGFVTHCGMVSILEAAVCGVPMIGWPIYAEQRMNRVFVVEEMKLALPLKETEGFVTAAELEKRIRELMESTAGREVRHRAEEMKVSAAAAARENGSSMVALNRFINALSQ